VSRVALRYAIIGTGNVGTASAQAFADRVAVTIANTRGPQSLASLAGDLALAVIPATIGDARKAEVILAAVPFLQTRELSAQVAGLGGKIDGRHQQRVSSTQRDEVPGGRLSTDTDAELFHGAEMVKAFNQTRAGQPNRKVAPEQGRRVVFIASNATTASATIADRATQIGFAPVEVEGPDAGGILVQARNALTLRNLYELPQ